MTKPPIGVAPHWFVYRKRIEELSDAIRRYIDHISKNYATENHAPHYAVIAEWAKEIETLASLEAELEKR